MSDGDVYKLSELWKSVHSKSKELKENASLFIDSMLGKRPEVGLDPPSKIKEHLDQHVIGQERAKKMLAIAAFTRGLRIHNDHPLVKEIHGDVKIDKSNIMLLGPTGSGKTFLVQTLAKFLDCTMIIEDLSTYTSSGYIGTDVVSIIGKLMDAAWDKVWYQGNWASYANQDFHNALKYEIEHSIVFLDEVDKIATKPGKDGSVSDVDVQEELLKMLEGHEYAIQTKSYSTRGSELNSRRLNSGQILADYLPHIDTKNILFICAGAFPDLNDIIMKRIEPSTIGFTGVVKASKKDIKKSYLDRVVTQDLVDYGLLPEFLGRLPVKVALNALTETDLVKILTEPEDCIVKQLTHIFKLYGRDLIIKPKALKKVAKTAIKHELGARGLKAILENSLFEHQYLAPDEPHGPPIVINEKDIDE